MTKLDELKRHVRVIEAEFEVISLAVEAWNRGVHAPALGERLGWVKDALDSMGRRLARAKKSLEETEEPTEEHAAEKPKAKSKKKRRPWRAYRADLETGDVMRLGNKFTLKEACRVHKKVNGDAKGRKSVILFWPKWAPKLEELFLNHSLDYLGAESSDESASCVNCAESEARPEVSKPRSKPVWNSYHCDLMTGEVSLLDGKLNLNEVKEVHDLCNSKAKKNQCVVVFWPAWAPQPQISLKPKEVTA